MGGKAVRISYAYTGMGINPSTGLYTTEWCLEKTTESVGRGDADLLVLLLLLRSTRYVYLRPKDRDKHAVDVP